MLPIEEATYTIHNLGITVKTMWKCRNLNLLQFLLNYMKFNFVDTKCSFYRSASSHHLFLSYVHFLHLLCYSFCFVYELRVLSL